MRCSHIASVRSEARVFYRTLSKKPTCVVTDEASSLPGDGQQRSPQLAKEEFVKARRHILPTEHVPLWLCIFLLGFFLQLAGALRQESTNKLFFYIKISLLLLEKKKSNFCF